MKETTHLLALCGVLTALGVVLQILCRRPMIDGTSSSVASTNSLSSAMMQLLPQFPVILSFL